MLLILPTAVSASIRAEAQGCAAALGGALSGTEEQLDTSLDFLSWNIQKATNKGWREDLRNFASDVDLAFIQEAAFQASITGALPVHMYQAFAAGYTRRFIPDST